MKRLLLWAVLGGSLLGGGAATTSWAEEKGLAELDKATQLQLNAETLADLEKVVEHCEQALEKGLSKENQEFAKELAANTLMDHARRLAGTIFDQPQRDPRWPVVRGFALRDLEKAVKYEPEMAEAHLLRAKLQAAPGGDRKDGLKAADAAVRLLKEDKNRLAQALVLRGRLSEDDEQQLKDWSDAIEADPGCTEAWQARAFYFMGKGENEKAIADLRKLIGAKADDVLARLALAEALISLKKLDEALSELDKVIAARPDVPAGYLLRARVHLLQRDNGKAIEALDQAIKVEPREVGALLMRSQLHLEADKFDLARNDVDRVLQLRPGLPQALLLRSAILAADKKYAEAIADLRQLLKEDADNTAIQMQIAQLYIAGGWPRQAIKLVTQVIEKHADDEDNWMALRARADALLNIGKHAEAIADYEKALKLQPDNHGILNNLAWVLATSPDDKLRDAKRSIELGKRACEVTDYKAAHILSTLAAGYAESGDFDMAIEWSTKAVDLGEGESKQQLQQELENYKQKKPWREKQETEEKPNPPPLESSTDL